MQVELALRALQQDRTHRVQIVVAVAAQRACPSFRHLEREESETRGVTAGLGWVWGEGRSQKRQQQFTGRGKTDENARYPPHTRTLKSREQLLLGSGSQKPD